LAGLNLAAKFLKAGACGKWFPQAFSHGSIPFQEGFVPFDIKNEEIKWIGNFLTKLTM